MNKPLVTPTGALVSGPATTALQRVINLEPEIVSPGGGRVAAVQLALIGKRRGLRPHGHRQKQQRRQRSKKWTSWEDFIIVIPGQQVTMTPLDKVVCPVSLEAIMTDPRYHKLAKLLVDYSTELKKGDRVLLDMIDVPDEFSIELIRAVRAAGAHAARRSRGTRASPASCCWT